MQDEAMRLEGLPIVYGLDQMHGTTYTSDGTIFPHQIGLAATFNSQLAHRMGEICAYETRACGVSWVFCPDMDIARKPSWPRHYETFGEDPYVATTMGLAYLNGLQGDDPSTIDQYHVGTCLKHFVGYGIPDNGIDRTPANIGYAELKEKHFMPFKALFADGATATMTNSSILNGQNGVANGMLLSGWLKDGIIWDGVILTDWGDIENLVQRDHIAATRKEAIKMAVNAGVDMMMVPSDLSYSNLLRQLVEEGEVSTERIDDAVRRILRMKMRMGLFDRCIFPLSDYPLLGSKQHADAALQTAVESMVLLKNDGKVLPIQRNKRILVCGPNANTMRSLNGGWTYSWQGNNTESFYLQFHTIADALRSEFGHYNVIYEPGVEYDNSADWDASREVDMSRLLSLAGECDYIVACVGENSYAETTGNINEIGLDTLQIKMVKKLSETGKPIILVLNEGRPRVVGEIVDCCKAVVDIMLPGNYGGDALALLLSGKENFSGRLPFTYPSHSNSFTTYDYKVCETRETMPGLYNYDANANAQWWFGEGMSYTSFAYSDLHVSKNHFVLGDTIDVSVVVENTGKVFGKETVMLFSSDEVASITPDNRRLRAFQKIMLQPGERKRVMMRLPANELAFVGEDLLWHLEKGDFKLQIGALTINITCDENQVFE